MENLNFKNADVYYYRNFLTQNEINILFEQISSFFKSETYRSVYLKEKNLSYKLNRKTAVFIDDFTNNYKIPNVWGNDIKIHLFTPELSSIKKRIEILTNFSFNICLVNYYLNGKQTIGWHSDNEEKGSTSCIASLSIGSEREFLFKDISKDIFKDEIYKKIKLENGSLLIMGKGCQENYQHTLPIDKNSKNPRINITFRLFDFDRYN